MSNFITRISLVDQIQALKAMLPAESGVFGISYEPNTHSLEIHWENGRLLTPYRYAVEFTKDQLQSGTLPENVKTEKEFIAQQRAQAEQRAKALAAAKDAEQKRVADILAQQAENVEREAKPAAKNKPLTGSRTRRTTETA